MKITAEFNSNEELLNFINTFGTTKVIQKIEPKQGVQSFTEKKEAIKETPKKEVNEDIKKDKKTNQHKNEQVQAADKSTEDKSKENTPVEEPKTEITKEMLRAVFSKLIQAGKQKEAKDITEKYGAKKLPDVKEEDYEAVMKEAEALL